MCMLGKWCAGLMIFLGMCSTSWAQIIHWEIDAVFDNFLLDGGFDFNTQTNAISNITLVNSPSMNPSDCTFCWHFSGAEAQLYAITGENPATGIHFFEQTFFTPTAYQINSVAMYVRGTDFFRHPGSYSDLIVGNVLYVWLDDPLDPDISISEFCIGCATAVGTPAPIPEPSTYGMLLAGLGLLGYQTRRRAGTK